MAFASRAKVVTRQRTFAVDGDKITIKSRPVTQYANLMGWNVWINGEKRYVNVLTREEAEDIAYVKWVKANH